MLVHNSFFVCLFESFFFFLTNLASLRANRARVERKGKKIYFLLSSSFAVEFCLFPYSFFEMKNPSPEVFLEIREFHSFIVKDFRDSVYI